MDIYIILKHDHIGGAEKRFAGLWQYLMEAQTENNYYLVLSPTLHGLLAAAAESAAGIKKFERYILFHAISGSYPSCSKAAAAFVRQYQQPDALFHFVEFFPMHIPHGARVCFSITASNLNIYSRKGRWVQWWGALRAAKVDILDPGIYQKMQRWLFFKKKRLHLTACTFCDTTKFTIGTKENWIVFLGIFSPVKQPLKYLQSIPAIYQKLRDRQLTDCRFLLFGYGELEAVMRDELRAKVYRDIPITISFENNPAAILAKSRVFISVQKYNNYPSKSLVEALASGNLPVVTNNGQTRWIADPSFSYYVPEDFTNSEIAEAVASVFSLSPDQVAEKANAARKFIQENHTLGKMAAYYQQHLFEN